MRVLLLFLLMTFSALPLHAQVVKHSANEAAVHEDLKLILRTAGLEESHIDFVRKTRGPFIPRENLAEIRCGPVSHIQIIIDAKDEEWGPTFYYALQKLGFLFPHPRLQISPSAEFKTPCGLKVVWRPRFEYRGFHLHTLHPSEWLHGFFMGDAAIATDTLRWLARNGQNTVEVVLLDQPLANIQENLVPLISVANSLGVSFGIDASFEMLQQHIYHVISPGSKLNAILLSLLGPEAETAALKKGLTELITALPFDFMSMELGTSEFTSTNYNRALANINDANTVLRAAGRALFIKVHASVNQSNSKYGNFNFLPQFAESSVGVLPHTLMFYGLEDASAPVYGRKDFQDLRAFIEREARKRPVWYYPETSYYIGTDIDVPLLLTDYLLVRSEDMDAVEAMGVRGHFTFSTGQELGYWLFDWTVALLTNADAKADPMRALKLLGEPIDEWRKILAFQNQYFKKDGLFAELSSANLLDELPFGQATLKRTILRNCTANTQDLRARIALLEKAWAHRPNIDAVRNPELKTLLQVTELRLQHALLLRQALLAETVTGRKSESWSLALSQAKDVRLRAQEKMQILIQSNDRYPTARIFSEQENFSSYPYGYGWTAANLHFWEREEEMIRLHKYCPWFMNIYDIRRLLL